MSAYLLDTCTIRHWFAQKPKINQRINSLPGDRFLYISTVSIGEIEFGHLSLAATDKKKQAEFRRWIGGKFADPVLELTPSTAVYYATFRRLICDNYFRKSKHIELYEDALSNKLGIDENDLWLVAHSHEHGLTFVTSDRMIRINEILGNKIILGDKVKIDYWPSD